MMIPATIKQLYISVIIIGVVAFLLFLSLASPVIINNSDFSIYNTGWNGCSSLAVETYRSGKFVPLLSYDRSTLTPVQHSFVSYDCNPYNTSLLCIGPKTDFTDQDAAYIDWFLSNGGIVLLADDFGSGNSLLVKLNTSTRFSDDLLLDLSFDKNASFSTIFHFNENSYPLIDNLSSLLVNYPSSIQASRTSTILISSSNLSWLDSDLNSRYDQHEEKGPFPLLTIEKYGKGTLIVTSTPSLFINSMKEYADNSVFIENILSFITYDRSEVIIDEGHRDVAIPFTLAISFPKTIDITIKISIILLVIIIYLLFFTPFTRKSIQFIINHLPGVNKKDDTIKTSSLVDDIIKDHPQWNKRKIESIVKRMREP